MYKPSVLEICAGGGGQALGLEAAGFEAVQLVEIDPHCCQTLRLNRPSWQVAEGNVCEFSAIPFKGVDLFAGGVPCPPFSVAGKQLGQMDERDLFPEALRLIEECQPKAVMLENVRGFLDPVFSAYRDNLKQQFSRLGYFVSWQILNASDFSVPQLRPRVVIVALQKSLFSGFTWPFPFGSIPPTVGEILFDLMASRGWKLAEDWKQNANSIAPTLVGGSKKHGGADLGPTRARKAWEALGVNGKGLADFAPEESFQGNPKLTVRMTARIQGFPDEWQFFGKKTPAYRQVGNAFPPPVACAVGQKILQALSRTCVSIPIAV